MGVWLLMGICGCWRCCAGGGGSKIVVAVHIIVIAKMATGLLGSCTGYLIASRLMGHVKLRGRQVVHE